MDLPLNGLQEVMRFDDEPSSLGDFRPVGKKADSGVGNSQRIFGILVSQYGVLK